MRQLSARVRWATVTALTIAASTGCVSVGDDAGKPTPSLSADRKGASALPDEATVSGTGRSGSGGGRAEAQSDRGAARKPDAKASGRIPSAEPGKAVPVPAGPGTPEPSRGGPLPTPEPSAPGPGEPPPPPVTPEEPPASPEPEPSPPPEQPSASPAAQSRTDATGLPGRGGMWPTPRVSPQVAPV
ncbi:MULTISPECIES: hypothetical protein [unclassified Streptomyces]|uniref:hypothetical protein n=1 Tax=unclassified Streptomyces TaxID=2593676 RepID=UPI002E1414F2|nr:MULTISPECIES: hypothetical protein [unclassified Streptomyces]WSQ78580.1 hypothetical protein OG725_16310 [Streptomyces sp. NBC_01213]WSQ85974.1 hypothetical protein OG722_17075 [Streptomyces sp. NBC_01212]WSR49317.1 hypothetical protein OG279_17470 [Streptomyces sp. NBC_01201]